MQLVIKLSIESQTGRYKITTLNKEIKRFIFVTFILKNGGKSLQILCNITFVMLDFEKNLRQSFSQMTNIDKSIIP